jgi:hypothetical protein
MTLSHRTRSHALRQHLTTPVTPLVLSVSNVSLAALKTAATDPTGTSGFAGAVAFLNNLSTYLIYLAVPAGVIGAIVGGMMMIGGSPDGPKWLARTFIGVGVVLLSKGIMA